MNCALLGVMWCVMLSLYVCVRLMWDIIINCMWISYVVRVFATRLQCACVCVYTYACTYACTYVCRVCMCVCTSPPATSHTLGCQKKFPADIASFCICSSPILYPFFVHIRMSGQGIWQYIIGLKFCKFLFPNPTRKCTTQKKVTQWTGFSKTLQRPCSYRWW